MEPIDAFVLRFIFNGRKGGAQENQLPKNSTEDREWKNNTPLPTFIRPSKKGVPSLHL